MSTPIYQTLADTLDQQIRASIFANGEKLPSVRKLSQQKGVSISTVLMAYNLLEDRDLIEVRPKSGYYVKRPIQKQFSAPKLQSTAGKPNLVSTSELVMDVMRTSSDPKYLSFGAATPALDFPIFAQLKKSFSQLVRTQPFLGKGYDMSLGNENLRRAIAKRALDAKVSVRPEEIIIASGCQSAIGLCLKALCKPGDIVAVESPSYYGLLQLIESMGLKAIEIPCDPEKGMSIEALSLALEQWPIKTILGVPSFNNPLGALMPEKNKRTLVELINRYEISFIEDDIYGELGYLEQRPSAVKHYDTEGRVLLCSSASKILEPRLGLGWIMPGRFMEAIEYERFLSGSSQFSLPQMAIGDIMNRSTYDRHIRLARDTYRQRRDRMFDLIAQHFPDDTRASSPQGGFVAWLQLPTKLDARALYLRAKEAGIIVAPGEIFSSSHNKFNRSIRITYSKEWTKDREGAIIALSNIVKQMA
jgi:DNA-binding transcriptional MocR family regulator